MAKINGLVYLAIGLVVMIASYLIDKEKFLLFIIIGAIMVMIGVVKIFAQSRKKKKERREKQSQHPASQMHHTQTHHQGNHPNMQHPMHRQQSHMHHPQHKVHPGMNRPAHMQQAPSGQQGSVNYGYRQCSKCGKYAQGNDNFCSNCGSYLQVRR